MIDNKKFPFSQHNDILSVTRLVSHMNCSLKWWFKYVLGIKEEKRYYLTRGNVFHEVKAEMLADPSKDTSYFEKRCFEIFQEFKVRGEPVSDEKVSEQQVLSLITMAIKEAHNFVKARNRFKLLTYVDPVTEPKLCAEIAFKVPLVDLDTMEPIPGIDRDLYGFIDEISWDENHGLTLRDHKLHASRPTLFELEMDLQLNLYAYVFKFLWKMGCFPELEEINLNAFIVGLNSYFINRSKTNVNAKFMAVQVTDEKIRQTVSLVADFYRNMQSAKPVPNYTPDCNWKCAFQEPCKLRRQGGDVVAWANAHNAELGRSNVKIVEPVSIFSDLQKKELFQI